ncbi:MAG: PucR family transcriptional regulator [Nocardioides sp.]
MTPPRPAAVPGAQALQRATGWLATTATGRMESDFDWFAALSAQERSWVGMIVQAGIQGFVRWYAEGEHSTVEPDLAASVFGSAPRALAGAITLQQTVDLIRLSIDVVEQSLDEVLAADAVPIARTAIGHYAREVAFATAAVYARAAEQRGAWDARLEALVVDAILRADPDEAVLCRPSALGWGARGSIMVVLGTAPTGHAETDLFEEVRRRARIADLHALCAVQRDRLVIVLGEVTDERAAATAVVDLFGPGTVVAGPRVADVAHAHASAAGAQAAFRAAPGWPGAPRPVLAEQLVVERAAAGDETARTELVTEVYRPLTERPALVETLTAYLESRSNLEAAARRLFVHPNTVRYRIRQIAELTGLSPSEPRDAFALATALVLGRQADA